MIDCRYIENRLLEIVEEAATAELPADVREHLGDCGRCYGLVQHCLPTFVQLEQEPQEVPDTLWRSLQQRVNLYEEKRQRARFLSPSWARLAAVSLRTFGLVAAAAVGVYLGSGIVGSQVSFAEQLADDYSLVLTDVPAGSVSESYLGLQWDNGGTGQ